MRTTDRTAQTCGGTHPWQSRSAYDRVECLCCLPTPAESRLQAKASTCHPRCGRRGPPPPAAVELAVAAPGLPAIFRVAMTLALPPEKPQATVLQRTWRIAVQLSFCTPVNFSCRPLFVPDGLDWIESSGLHRRIRPEN